MRKSIFLFGRTPDLSWLELSSLFITAERLGPNIGLVNNLSNSPEELVNELGGTIKIAEVLGEIDAVEVSKLIQFFPNGEQKLVFGISIYGNEKLPVKLLSDMKQMLKSRIGHVSFVESEHGETLSSVVIAKKQVYELVVIKQNNKYLVAHTVAVQDFEEWSRRDYSRPYSDPKAGMLPPKVARMVVNIALKNSQERNFQGKQVLLDPFCGMGTILAEAWLSGWRVIGADQSSDVVKKARANLAWLTTNYPKQTDIGPGLLECDATHISDQVVENSVDAIVTEPFMGNTVIDVANVKNIVKGLEKLYLGCLKDWSKVLKPSGKIVMALPKYEVGDRTYFVKKVVDNCEKLGYTIQVGPIEYSRPQAIVKREFFVFQKYGTR